MFRVSGCCVTRTSTRADHCAWSCPSLTDGAGRTCSCSLRRICAIEFIVFLPSKIGAFTESERTKNVWAHCLTCPHKFKYKGDLRGEVAMCKKEGVGVRCRQCEHWGCRVVEDAEPVGADEES